MRFLYLVLLGMCGVCSHVVVLGLSVSLVSCMDAVTVMCVLLLMLDVYMLKECGGARVRQCWCDGRGM